MIIVSKATKRHCAVTVQSQGGRVGNLGVHLGGVFICLPFCSLFMLMIASVSCAILDMIFTSV